MFFSFLYELDPRIKSPQKDQKKKFDTPSIQTPEGREKKWELIVSGF